MWISPVSFASGTRVWASLRPLSSLSVSHKCILCICLAPQACPLLGGVCVHLSWLPCLPSASQAGVHLSRLLSPALCFAGLVCTLILAPQDCPLCHRAGVHVFFSHQSALLAVGLTCSSFSSQAHPLCTAQVCMPPLYQHPRSSLCTRCVCRHRIRYLDSPSVLQA